MKIKEGFVTQALGEKTIVVSTGELSKTFHGMIELNRTGADIWNWVAEGLSEEQIIEKFAKEYGISLEKARGDVQRLIKHMEMAGILEDVCK